MPVLRTKTSRMWLPDALRGLALLNMLAYHAMYDWVYVFGHESSWYNICLLYTSPSPRDLSTSRMPSSA